LPFFPHVVFRRPSAIARTRSERPFLPRGSCNRHLLPFTWTERRWALRSFLLGRALFDVELLCEQYHPLLPSSPPIHVSFSLRLLFFPRCTPLRTVRKPPLPISSHLAGCRVLVALHRVEPRKTAPGGEIESSTYVALLDWVDEVRSLRSVTLARAGRRGPRLYSGPPYFGVTAQLPSPRPPSACTPHRALNSHLSALTRIVAAHILPADVLSPSKERRR